MQPLMSTRKKKSTSRSASSPRKPGRDLPASGTAPEVGEESLRQDVGSLQRGLAILDAVVKTERPLTSSEISDAVGLNPSTTHRLLRSLSEMGYLFRDASKRYYPSARALFPSNLFHPLNVLRRNSMEELLSLRRRFGLAVALVVFIDFKRWVLETIHGNDSFSPYTDTEVLASLHTTVAGKILLSSMPSDARSKLIGSGPYEALTSKTITSPKDLERELSAVEAQGYATSLDEMLQGLSAVGAPIWCAPRRPLGAVIMSGATKHFDDSRLKEMATAVAHSAGLFSFASPDVRAVCRFLGHGR